MKLFAIERNDPQHIGGNSALRRLAFLSAACVLAFSCMATAQSPTPIAQIEGKGLKIEFDRNLQSRIIANTETTPITLGPFAASETVKTATVVWKDFRFVSQQSEHVRDTIGAAEVLTVNGKAAGLVKTVNVRIYDDYPTMAIFDVQYTNSGTTPLAITKWINNAYTVAIQGNAGKPAFWS